MSALELTPLPQSNRSTDRRDVPRLRVANHLLVLIGRGEGVLLDLSKRGARVRHSVQARRAENVRLSFDWEGERFSATAEVLSSHVVTLGRDDVPTLYETRLRFRILTGEAEAILDRTIAALESGTERKWLANLEGTSDSDRGHRPRATGSFLRCRLIGRRWERKWTYDRIQPKDGFVLPESVDTKEVDRLCGTFETADEDGRQLIRLIAAASIT